jgi:hypothetical protein
MIGENLAAYAHSLSDAIQAHFGIKLSPQFVGRFVFEAIHGDVALHEDMGQLVFLECCKLHSEGEELSEESILKVMHRVRTRLVRQARRGHELSLSDVPITAGTSGPSSVARDCRRSACRERAGFSRLLL